MEEQKEVIWISASKVPLKRFLREQVQEMIRTENDLFFPLFQGWFDKSEYKKLNTKVLLDPETETRHILYF